MSEENTVFIGKKETMNYVMAVITQFNSGSDEVLIKARGRAISKAVDVAEIVRNKFLPDITVSDISISTENLDAGDGRDATDVSSIKITMSL